MRECEEYNERKENAYYASLMLPSLCQHFDGVTCNLDVRLSPKSSNGKSGVSEKGRWNVASGDVRIGWNGKGRELHCRWQVYTYTYTVYFTLDVS